MSKKVNQYRIYLKAAHKWVEVSEEIYLDHIKFHDAFRKRNQSHGRCICPKNKFWLCDSDCYNCEFQQAGDLLSLDVKLSKDDDEEFSKLDMLSDLSTLTEEIAIDTVMLEQLLEKLEGLMPEARKIAILRLRGFSDTEIAEKLEFKRTTMLSRFNKALAELGIDLSDFI